MVDLLGKLIEEVQDKDIPLSNLLRRAKVLASRLDQTDFLKWIDLELKGYETNTDVPKYRQIAGQVQGYNPYRGWVPVVFSSTEIEQNVSVRGTSQSISEIEELLSHKDATFEIPFPDEIAAKVLRGTSIKTKVSVFIGGSALAGLLNAVRNMLFDWLLKMEKEGAKVQDNTEPQDVGGASFNETKSMLLLNGTNIKVSKNKDSDPHYLMAILFKDRQKEWAYDEIWEDPYFHSRNAEYDPKKDWRKIYNAAYSLNEKVAKATTLSDFLVISKTAVSVNKKYL